MLFSTKSIEIRNAASQCEIRLRLDMLPLKQNLVIFMVCFRGEHITLPFVWEIFIPLFQVRFYVLHDIYNYMSFLGVASRLLHGFKMCNFFA